MLRQARLPEQVAESVLQTMSLLLSRWQGKAGEIPYGSFAAVSIKGFAVTPIMAFDPESIKIFF